MTRERKTLVNTNELTGTHRILFDLIRNTPVDQAIIAADNHNRILLWSKGAEDLLGFSSDEMLGEKCMIHPPCRQESLFFNEILTTKQGKPLDVTITAAADGSDDTEPSGYLYIIRDASNEVLQEKFRLIIVEIARIASKKQTLTAMLDTIIHAIQSHLELSLVYCCFNDHGEQFFVKSYSGVEEKFSYSCNMNTIGSCCMSPMCQKAYLDSVTTYEDISVHHVSNLLPSLKLFQEPQSVIHVPLFSEDVVVGLLHFVIPKSMIRKFVENSLLGLIASKVSSAILTRRLEESLQSYADNLEQTIKLRTDELREKDAQILQSTKLATLGEMATGIAHEINQPLGGISLMTQGLLKAIEKEKLTPDLLVERLKSINEQIERINRIINHLRVFGRQAPETKTAVNVNKPLRDVFELIGQQLVQRNIHIQLELNDKLPEVLADHTRLEQVFINIISNARDALDEQELHIRFLLRQRNYPDWVKGWKKELLIKTSQEHQQIIVEIRDNAGGIEENLLQKIFEPFFTTKEVGKGTGLGLSISYGIIKEFGGEISVDSEIDRGSSFYVRLPVWDNEASA